MSRLEAPRSEPRERPEIVEPESRHSLTTRRRNTAYALALALPVATSVALIPVRQSHSAAAALLMLLPVVLVAVIGTTGPAIVAAVAATAAFDVLLTRPYYHPNISSADDITAALTVAVVGLTVGVLSGRLSGLASRDKARRNELRQLISFIDTAPHASTIDDLGVDAARHLTGVLGLRSCRWTTEPGGVDVPVLLPTGAVMGPLRSMNSNRSVLPDTIELPVEAGTATSGRFVMSPEPGHPTSLEERLTAVTIASLFGTHAARLVDS